MQTDASDSWRSVEKLSKTEKASQLQLLLGKAAQYTNFLSKKLNLNSETNVKFGHVHKTACIFLLTTQRRITMVLTGNEEKSHQKKLCLLTK